MTDTRTGWELVAAAQTGDTDAFAELYRRYKPNVAHYIASCVHHRATTEDLTSETFLRAWRRIRTVANVGKGVDAWLIRIARNAVIDHTRRAHTQHSTPVAEFDAGFDLLPPTAGPEVTVPAQRCEADTARRLAQMVGGLPASQQTVIGHRFYGGLSAADTAARMGCSVAAVRGAQHRAVTSLRTAGAAGPHGG
jgi:RNA polymerase sigma-70 factor (ECF subfamily)